MSVKAICSENYKWQGVARNDNGILKYLAQFNNSADCVSEENRFCFSSDLSVLVIVNLLTISPFNIRGQVAHDIPGHNQSFLQSEV